MLSQMVGFPSFLRFYVILDYKVILMTLLFFYEEGNGNPFQYSCLEKSMDRRAWKATVRGVT